MEINSKGMIRVGSEERKLPEIWQIEVALGWLTAPKTGAFCCNQGAWGGRHSLANQLGNCPISQEESAVAGPVGSRDFLRRAQTYLNTFPPQSEMLCGTVRGRAQFDSRQAFSGVA